MSAIAEAIGRLVIVVRHNWLVRMILPAGGLATFRSAHKDRPVSTGRSAGHSIGSPDRPPTCQTPPSKPTSDPPDHTPPDRDIARSAEEREDPGTHHRTDTDERRLSNHQKSTNMLWQIAY
jgi:hypothetical protein